MITQSASINKKLSNVVAAGVAFTVLSVVAGTLWILFSHKQVLDMRAEYAMLKDSVETLHQQGLPPVEPEETITAIIPPKTEPEAVIQKTAKPKDTVITPLKPALKSVVNPPVNAVPTIVRTEQAKPVNRKSIVLSYYHRRADNESLQVTLKGLGYNFDTKTLEKNTGYQKSNCIWFGADVPLADVKRIAIAMIQSGNTLKGIKRFPLSAKRPSYKRNVIEVGLEIKYETYYTKPLSIVEVERTKNFK